MDGYKHLEQHQIPGKTSPFVFPALILLSVALIWALWDMSKLDDEITALQMKVQEKDKQISALTVVAKRVPLECANQAH